MASLLRSARQRRAFSFWTPSVVEQTGYGERAYDIYTRLLKDRIVCLHSSVRPEQTSFIVAQLLYLDSTDPGRPIQLYINSPGGSLNDGMAIYDTMQYIRSPVHTVGMGMAGSMASLLLAAGEKGKRFALPNCRIMIHQPHGGAQGQASDIKILAEEILNARTCMQQLYHKHTGMPVSDIERALERDTYLSAEQAKELGLIDEVITKAVAAAQ